MSLSSRILKLAGYKYSQEYLCLAERLDNPLHAYVVVNGIIKKDITNDHVFAGYQPLIFVITRQKDFNLGGFHEVEVCFSQIKLSEGSSLQSGDSLAWLKLKFIESRSIEGDEIYIFEGISGKHKFQSRSGQVLISMHNQLFKRKTGNVFLNNNLYHQVQIAYSLPRAISLITLSEEGMYNLIPTDLNGAIGQNGYIISLRHEGLACRQLESARKLVISRIKPELYKQVYGLGKNHMQSLKPAAELPFSGQKSKIFDLPLPLNTISYMELEVVEAFLHGIHKLFLMRITNQEKIVEGFSLFHIHNCYASWRRKQGLQSNYLLR